MSYDPRMFKLPGSRLEIEILPAEPGDEPGSLNPAVHVRGVIGLTNGIDFVVDSKWVRLSRATGPDWKCVADVVFVDAEGFTVVTIDGNDTATRIRGEGIALRLRRCVRNSLGHFGWTRAGWKDLSMQLATTA